VPCNSPPAACQASPRRRAMIPEAARKTIKEWKADQRVDDLRGDGVQAGRLERRMVVSDAGTTRAAGAIGFVTEVTNVTPASAGRSGPATLATPAPLWPRERPNSRQNGHERTAGVAKETVAWPKRRWRGKETLARSKRSRPPPTESTTAASVDSQSLPLTPPSWARRVPLRIPGSRCSPAPPTRRIRYCRRRRITRFRT